MDRHGIFRRNDDHWSLQEQLAGEQTPTQVGQALRALGIEPIFALSPQAKGRVERLFNTLQDRLVQELRLAGITTLNGQRRFVNGPFKADFNARFAKPRGKANRLAAAAQRTRCRSDLQLWLSSHCRQR